MHRCCNTYRQHRFTKERRIYSRLQLQEFKRHIKREYGKLLAVLQAYALISTGVRIICTNQVSTHFWGP